MRLPLLILFTFVLNMVIVDYSFAATIIAADKKTDENPINFDEPPFWMPSYDEFADLDKEQKDYYLAHFLPQLKDVPLLNEVSKDQLQDASEWAASWKDLMVKVYRFCQDKSATKKCESISETRLEALDLNANQSESNRKARSVSSADKK